MITGEQKALALLAHIAYFLGGLGFVFAPLLLFILKKDDTFVYEHAKQALMVQILLLILSTIVFVLSFFVVGILLLPFLAVAGLLFFVTSLLAAYRAICGESYEYPLIQVFVRKF